MPSLLQHWCVSGQVMSALWTTLNPAIDKLDDVVRRGAEPEPAEPDTHPSTLPAHLREMSYEDVKSDLTYEDLTEHEKQIYRYLKVKTTKGIPYILQYRNGWGKGGVDEHGQITRKQPKTPAFKSKAALVRALLQWAGEQWVARIHHP